MEGNKKIVLTRAQIVIAERFAEIETEILQEAAAKKGEEFDYDAVYKVQRMEHIKRYALAKREIEKELAEKAANEFTEGQQKVLRAMRHAPLGEGERDEGFHVTLAKLVEDERASNIIKAYIPNMHILLNVKKEALLQLPNCGKKTAGRILAVQEKLLKHGSLLMKIRNTIKTYNALAEYRKEHTVIIGNYHELRKDYEGWDRYFLDAWKSCNGG